MTSGCGCGRGSEYCPRLLLAAPGGAALSGLSAKDRTVDVANIPMVLNSTVTDKRQASESGAGFNALL